MTDGASPPVVVKARKVPRMTYKQEIQTIKNLPRVQRLIVIMKIAGVFLVAIGLEGMVIALQAAGPNSVRDGFILMAVFIPLGVFVSMFPIRIRTGACVACMSPLERDQAICPKCGAPQM
ncbi:MAG: hypothetical protein E6J93_00485 [Methanobacteriota archaeon]|nr:MAG: hypothetical protein E6J93_00485 [Euryarchaeota archaeon]